MSKNYQPDFRYAQEGEVYTRGEADAQFYSRAEVDALFANYYTRAEVDDLLASFGISDPLYDDVVLLILPTGSPGDTTLTDQGPAGQSITFFDDAEISAELIQGEVSVALDNTDDRLITACTGLDLTGDWTIEGYFIQDSIVGTYGFFHIGTFGVDAGRVMLYAVDGQVWCFVNDTSNVTMSWPRSSTTDITVGTEFHVAAVKSGGTLRVYVDGSQVASDTYTGNTDVSVSTAFVGVSRTSATNRFLNGHAGPVRVTGAARYTSAFTPGEFYPR